MSETYDYIIIGGGISGVTMARLLQLSGVKSFLVLEASDQPGGLCQTKRVGDHFLDTGGGHFLCTRYPMVYDFVFGHIPKSDFNYFRRISKISFAGVQVDYPLESNVWQLPLDQRTEFLISIIRNGEASGASPPSNFEAWCRWKLGDKLTDIYMLPYNRKIWGVEPHEMDVDWLHKIPRLNVDDVVRSCLEQKSDAEKMPSHAGFYYPKKGGFQEVFDAILAPVRNSVKTSEPVHTVEQAGSILTVNRNYRAKRIINTAPWHALAESPIFDAKDREHILGLRNNSIVVSLHEEPVKTPAHWVYEPDITLPHHRRFFINNFAPHSAANGVYRETNSKRWMAEIGEIYSHENEYAYPIPTVGWSSRIKSLLASCEQKQLYGLGRWGQWEYFNSDVCIHEAMKLSDTLGHQGWRSRL